MEETLKVIVIPYENNSQIFDVYCEEHKRGIFDAISYYGIELPKELTYMNVDFIELARMISTLGYLSIFYIKSKKHQFEEQIIVLPKKISKFQKEYFEDKKDYLKNINLMLELEENDDKWKSLDNAITNLSIVDILYDELNKRLVKEKNIKELKYIKN